MEQKKKSKTNNKKINKPKNKEKKNFTKEIEKNIKNPKKSSKLKKITIVVCIVISIITLLTLMIRALYLDEVNNKYAKKIKVWGLNKLYSNEQIYSWQNVTKIEAIKLIVSASNNNTNARSLYNPVEEMTDDEIFMYYANYHKLIDDESITNENMYEQATLLDVIMLINNSRRSILKRKIVKVGSPDFSDFNTYTDIQKAYIRNLVADEIIENKKEELKAEKSIKKGELNKIIVNYVYKYSIFAPEGEIMVENEEELPSNADMYPYILKSVPKEVYEQENTIFDYDYYINAADFFDIRRTYYASTVYNSNQYFDALLNIDYNTITYESLRDSIKDYVVGACEENILKSYVEYVKKNKIKITGKSTPCLPAIYNDGRKSVIRTKLEFKIESSDTKENLLCFDDMYGAKVYYDETDYEIYIDAQMGYVVGSKIVYNEQIPIYISLLNISKSKLRVLNGNLYSICIKEEGAMI